MSSQPIPQPGSSPAWDALGLPDESVKELRTISRVFRDIENLEKHGFPLFRGVLLYGSGTHKSHIAQIFALESGRPLMVASASDANLDIPELFERARTEKPCVVFIDEIEKISRATVTQLLIEIDGRKDDLASSHLLLVAATDQINRVDGALVRHIQMHIEIPGLSAVSGSPAGQERPAEAVTVPRTAPCMWDDLVLPANVVAQFDGLRTSILEAAHLPLQSPPRHALLWGAPGTGKTAILRAFAESLDGSGVRAEWACGPEFHGTGYIRQAGNAVREIFGRVRRAAPAVFLLDLEQGPYSDDCVFPSRESLVAGGTLTINDTERIEAALAEMDRTCFDRKAPIWMIAEIFSPDRLDPTMRRRFSLEIELPLPNESARREILTRQITSRALAIGTDISGLGFDLDEACSAVAARTEGKSGRDLVYIVQKALENSAERAERDHSAQRTLAREDLLGAAEPRR